jgi:hypothetical protein
MYSQFDLNWDKKSAKKCLQIIKKEYSGLSPYIVHVHITVKTLNSNYAIERAKTRGKT